MANPPDNKQPQSPTPEMTNEKQPQEPQDKPASTGKPGPRQLTFKSISKTLDGNILVSDHPRIMFVVSPSKRKLTMLLKHNIKDEFYPIQKRFLEFAISKGIVVLGTEHTGYLPNMFEFTYPENKDIDSVKVILFFIHSFIQTEMDMYSTLEKLKNELETRLLQPDEEHSTELGEIPHEREKGAKGTNPYMNYVNSYFGWYL